MPSYAPGGQTVGLSPIVFENFGPQIVEDTVCRVSVFVFASDHDTGQAYWEFRVLLKKNIGNLMEGIAQQVVNRATPAAATWTAVVSVSDDRVKATCTGALGATVDWLVTSDEVFCMIGPYVAP